MDNWLQQTQSVVFGLGTNIDSITESSLKPAPESPPKKGIKWPIFGQANQFITNKEIPPTLPQLH